jgi:hypothetical protein
LKLQVFLDHGAVPLDNNRVENAIRPTKLGAKNWLFIGGEETGHQARSSTLWSRTSGRPAQIRSPISKTSSSFERLPAMTNQDDLRPLLPLNWLAHQTSHTRVA